MKFGICFVGLAVAAIAICQGDTAPRYEVRLRMPAEGLFAGEETDLEFRVGDLSKNDRILGPAGVRGCKIRAWVSMPEMPGMPEIRPQWHAEGVPGDYGLVFSFPHGGSYWLRLEVTPPEGKPFTFESKLDVGDERPAGRTQKTRPYILTASSPGARAGLGSELRLAITDAKTKSVVKDFDEAHTKRFHLLLASKDFVWFLHEHPVQAADGTWSVRVTFPAGGEYWVYADVAPIGKGSMILASKLSVAGAKPTWITSWAPNLGPVSDADLSGQLMLPKGGVPVGSTSMIAVRLIDKSSRKPIEDLQPWLGAMGHLMIFSSDGQTVVHSHPASEEVIDGTVKFSARFPKAALYRAFAQFQRGGSVRTLSFTIEVRK